MSKTSRQITSGNGFCRFCASEYPSPEMKNCPSCDAATPPMRKPPEKVAKYCPRCLHGRRGTKCAMNRFMICPACLHSWAVQFLFPAEALVAHKEISRQLVASEKIRHAFLTVHFDAINPPYYMTFRNLVILGIPPPDGCDNTYAIRLIREGKKNGLHHKWFDQTLNIDEGYDLICGRSGISIEPHKTPFTSGRELAYEIWREEINMKDVLKTNDFVSAFEANQRAEKTFVDLFTEAVGQLTPLK